MTERFVLDVRSPRQWEDWLSPRNPTSGLSKSNVERVDRLVDAGRMRPAGQREMDAAKADGRWPTH